MRSLRLPHARSSAYQRQPAAVLPVFQIQRDLQVQAPQHPPRRAARAQNNLGIIYANGEGVPQDDAEACASTVSSPIPMTA